jgi:hypothetical protein
MLVIITLKLITSLDSLSFNSTLGS